MKYAKPQVALLGPATAAIQLQTGKIPYSPSDGQQSSAKFTVSAYEADE
jgi:hypothetical protein